MLEKIKINVGGQIFVTKKSTLQRYPDTKLSNIAETCEHYDENCREYFYDRNPLIFHSILDYYRTGNLHFVSNVCAEHIREELNFWGLFASDLGPCCWKHFYTVDSDLKTVGVVQKHFCEQKYSYCGSKHSIRKVKNKVWFLLEYPRSSKIALIWQLFYLLVVGLAIVLSVLQSFEISRKDHHGDHNITEEDIRERLTDHDDWVIIVTHMCNVVFALETSLRVFSCPDKLEFLKSFLNVVDIVSVIGYFVLLIVDALPDSGKNYESFFAFSYTLVILRGFRFFRLERFIEGLRLMLLSIKQSKKMLCLLVLVLVITAIIFGITIHIIEMDGAFSDPVSSFYWAVITMTTIGYGDIYPKTTPGQIVASSCATVGLFLLSMPIAVVANTFTDLHNRYSERNSHFKQRTLCVKKEEHELIPMKF